MAEVFRGRCEEGIHDFDHAKSSQRLEHSVRAQIWIRPLKELVRLHPELLGACNELATCRRVARESPYGEAEGVILAAASSSKPNTIMPILII